MSALYNAKLAFPILAFKSEVLSVLKIVFFLCVAPFLLFALGCSDFQAGSLGPQLPLTLDQQQDITIAFQEQKVATNACFTERLASKPGLSGTMMISFLIDDRGTPLQMSLNKSRGTLADEELADCIFQAMEDFDFPLAPKNQFLKVDHGLQF